MLVNFIKRIIKDSFKRLWYRVIEGGEGFLISKVKIFVMFGIVVFNVLEI